MPIHFVSPLYYMLPCISTSGFGGTHHLVPCKYFMPSKQKQLLYVSLCKLMCDKPYKLIIGYDKNCTPIKPFN